MGNDDFSPKPYRPPAKLISAPDHISLLPYMPNDIGRTGFTKCLFYCAFTYFVLYGFKDMYTYLKAIFPVIFFVQLKLY